MLLFIFIWFNVILLIFFILLLISVINAFELLAEPNVLFWKYILLLVVSILLPFTINELHIILLIFEILLELLTCKGNNDLAIPSVIDDKLFNNETLVWIKVLFNFKPVDK